jgi:hypothetical protein
MRIHAIQTGRVQLKQAQMSLDETTALATLAALRATCATRPTVYLPMHDPAAGARLQQRSAAVVAP